MPEGLTTAPAPTPPPYYSGNNNVWRVKLQGKGEPQPQTIELRGPVDIRVVKQHAQMMANAQSRRAVSRGFPDPEVKIVGEPEPIGTNNDPVGMYSPAGAQQIDLNRYANDAPTTGKAAK